MDKKTGAILGVIILVIVLLFTSIFKIAKNNMLGDNETKVEDKETKKNKKDKNKVEDEDEEDDDIDWSKIDVDEIEDLDRKIEVLNNKYGKPPVGFRWADDGESLISLGADGVDPEEVGFIFLRALSNLDFETADRFSHRSKVINSFEMNVVDEDEFDYSKKYKDRVFKAGLKSMEINGIKDSTTFANEKISITYSISVLDNTYKDFWLDDLDTIYRTIEKYKREEDDSTKAKEYVDNYILEYYESDNFKRRDLDIKLNLMTNVDGSWVVVGDDELLGYLTNVEGNNVNNFIMLKQNEDRDDYFYEDDF